MAVFHVYIDESGKMHKGDYTSLCGFIAHDIEWQRFGEMWNSCRLRWGVPPLHMSLIMRSEATPAKKNDAWAEIRQKWGKEWEERRDALLKDFSSIIGATGLVAIGAVLDVNKYRDLHATHPALDKVDSNVFALHLLTMGSIERVVKVDRAAILSLIIDDDEENAMNYYKAISVLRNHPQKDIFGQVSKRIHGICFCNDNSYPGLQAADMLAYLSREMMVKRKQNEMAEPNSLWVRITHNLLNQPVLFDSDHLDKVFKNMADK